jgi:hypothetical protein
MGQEEFVHAVVEIGRPLDEDGPGAALPDQLPHEAGGRGTVMADREEEDRGREVKKRIEVVKIRQVVYPGDQGRQLRAW